MGDTAVLLIAHGSPDPDWLALVESSVPGSVADLPVRVAFLGGVEGRSIAEEWRRLEEAGAKRIIVLPLFVTAGSGHVGEIRSMLGLEPWRQEDKERWQIPAKARILWCPPLEDHPLVEQIVEERVRTLAANPQGEALLLVGHGSDSPMGQAKWERLMHRLTLRLQNKFFFAAAGYGTLRPDTLRTAAGSLSAKGELVVVPLFVSQGYYTRKGIPQRLEGLPYRYDGSAYLPHPAIAEWIRQSVRTALASDILTQRSVYENGRKKAVEMGG